MMDMSPSAAFIVGIVVLLSVIAVIVVGMRVVGQRLKDGEEQPHRPAVSPRQIRTNDSALTAPAA